MKRIQLTKVFEWKNRLMTEEEAEKLFTHLSALYDAIGEAEIIISSALQHSEYFMEYLEVANGK